MEPTKMPDRQRADPQHKQYISNVHLLAGYSPDNEIDE